MKRVLFLLSMVFICFFATIAFAEISVKRDIRNSIQHIQNIYFSSGAVKNLLNDDNNIRLRSENGMVNIEGKVLMQISGAANVLGSGFQGSSIIYGKSNVLSGSNSFIIVGKQNRIDSNVTGGVILGGYKNNIIGNSDGAVIAGGSENSIKGGKNLLILGSMGSNVSGSGIVVLGGGDISLTGDSLIALGQHIQVGSGEKMFIWNDGTKDVLTGGKNSFLIYSHNGIGIGTWTRETTDSGTFSGDVFVNVNGVAQFGNENVSCNSYTAGSIQYTGACYCGCNGSQWVSMIPTVECKKSCSNNYILGSGPSCLKASEEVSHSWLSNEIATNPAGLCINGDLLGGVPGIVLTENQARWQCISGYPVQIATCVVWWNS